MTSAAPAENCIDIVRPFSNELDRAGLLTDVQFVGGIGSAALAHEGTEIRPDEGIVVAPRDLYLPNIRDDGNKRDMDVLVLSADEDRIAEIEGIAEQTVGERLEVSIFGLRDWDHVEKQLQHPVFGWKALKTFTGDRYIFEGEKGTVISKVLFPFGTEIPPESMSSSRLNVNGLEVPVATPPGALMNYATRSISGIRAKDAGKLEAMAKNVFKQAPDYADWIRTGPGRSLLELARVFHTLQGPDSFEEAEAHVLGGAVSIEPLPRDSLAKHHTFLLRDFSESTQRHALAWARIKSIVLSEAESHEEIVRLYQKWAEKLFDGITKNK